MKTYIVPCADDSPTYKSNLQATATTTDIFNSFFIPKCYEHIITSFLSSTLKCTNFEVTFQSFFGQFLWKFETSLEHVKAQQSVGCSGFQYQYQE